MKIGIRSEGVHDIDGVGGLKLPWSGLERVWEIVKSSDWAKIDNVTGKLVGDHTLNVS